MHPAKLILKIPKIPAAVAIQDLINRLATAKVVICAAQKINTLVKCSGHRKVMW